jgi:hypothetical protein
MGAVGAIDLVCNLFTEQEVGAMLLKKDGTAGSCAG